MWYDCIRKLRGHVCKTMRFWRIQKQTEQDNPCLWFLFYFTSLSTRTWPLHFGDPARTCQCGDLFDFIHSQKMFTCVSFECAAIASSCPRYLCGSLIHSCENWFAFGMEVLLWCVSLSLSCFSFVRNYWIQEGVGDIFLSSLRRVWWSWQRI